ncbi:MAG: GAF domain-containing sensor histidine kinase, partial [Candidatus Levyibacteriota bacterium]
VMPAFGYFQLNWLGPLFSIIWISCLAYAIIKHRLLDIRFVVARTIAYIVLVVILGFFYALSVFIFANIFFKQTTATDYTYLSTVLALLIAFSIHPLKNFLENITDTIFFKGKYSSNELVLRLTQIMASTLHQEALTKTTLNQLLMTMRITRGAFILFKPHHQMHVLRQGDRREEPNFETIKKLFTLKRVVILEEEEDEAIKELMREINMVVAVPLFEDTHDEGLLVLGEKKSGEIYSQQDVEVLEIFGPEVAVALHNAESYEAISTFNITLKKEIEKETKDVVAANEKLKQLDKLKNEFVSVASHELRTPMTAIRSYLWMALEGKGGALNDKQKYYLERGYNSVDRLIRLVNDMLNISRIESGRINVEMKSVDVISLTQEIVDEVSPRSQELGVTVTIQKPDSLPLVLADPDKIKEVLFNLIGNSLKFTPKGGKVTVSYSHAHGFVETKVVDNGSGIEAEDIGKLFQKFGLIAGSYTTNQPVSGTGLGLYICRTIIELHQGKIKAASEGRGKGATFTFTLKELTKADEQALTSASMDEKREKVELIHTQF